MLMTMCVCSCFVTVKEMFYQIVMVWKVTSCRVDIDRICRCNVKSLVQCMVGEVLFNMHWMRLVK